MTRLFLLLILSAPVVPGADWRTHIARGDALDARFQTAAALAAYQAAEREQPGNSRLLSKIAKQHGESMADTTDPAEKVRRGTLALDYARRAVAADASCGVAHVSLAICYGRLALLVDNRTKMDYSREVKRHGEVALRLAPENDLCWHLLGAWHLGMSDLNPVLRTMASVVYGSLPRASREEALRHFKKAVELNPRRPGNHLQLGRTYAALDRKAEARAALEKGLALPDVQRDDPENKRKARVLLARL